MMGLFFALEPDQQDLTYEQNSRINSPDAFRLIAIYMDTLVLAVYLAQNIGNLSVNEINMEVKSK